MEEEVLRTAVRCGCSAYDAAYLALAERHGWELATGDERFFRPLSGSCPSVRRVEDVASQLG